MANQQRKTYKKPNLKDPRVRNRIETVLNWAMPKIGLSEPFHCHTDTLRKVFSNHNRGLGFYLYTNILKQPVCNSYRVQTANREPICKTYRISESGFNKVCGMLYGVADLPPTATESKKRKFSVRYARDKYKDELDGKKRFSYDDRSYRLSHELQGFKRELKDEIFEGWHDYDISAAMPSIFWNLHQHFQAMNVINEGARKSHQELYFIEDYMNDKAKIRRELADRLNIDLDAAKSIINGLFQRMRLVPHHTCSAFSLVGFDSEKMLTVKADHFIKGMQKDIRKFWALTSKRVNTKRTLARLPKIERNLLYFFHERQVIDVVRKYLTDIGTIHFLEQDGFRTKEPVDLDKIKKIVKEQTKFDLIWEER